MAVMGSVVIEGGDLTEAIQELTKAVRYQGDTIATLMDAADKETLQDLFHGFKQGDDVAMFTTAGEVLTGKVDTDKKLANPEKNISVKRSDGVYDAWPVRYMILVDDRTRPFIEKAAPKPTLGVGTPPPGTDRVRWNFEAAKIAEKDNLVVTFKYVKPDFWSADGSQRRVLVQKFEAVSETNPAMQSIGGIDLDVPESVASRYRTFRLDRVEGYIVIDNELPL